MKKKVLTNHQLQSVFEQAAVGMVIVDAVQNRFVEVNRRFCEMVGYSAKELMQGSIHDITHPDDLRMDLDHVDRISAGIIRESSWEKRYRKKDGTIVWARVFVTPLDPYEAKPTLRLGVIEDITKRKQAEEALRESESRMRTITDSAQDAILMMNPEGLISYWNPAAERIFGYTDAEAIGQNLHELIVPSHYHEAHRAAFPLFQKKGQGATVGKTLDLEALRKDGEEISVQLSLSAIHIKGAWHAVGVLRDITERRRIEEALKKREAQLNEMGRIAKVGGWEFDTESQKQVWTNEVYHIHEVDESYEPNVSKGIAFYVPASRPIIERAVQRAMEYGEPFDVELEIVTAKGNHRWVHANGKVDREHGTKKIISGTFQDVTERRQAEEKIRQMAYHVSLTGLPNRMLLIDRMTMAINQADRNRNKVVCMMLDLDKFKEVNDTLGHHIGDLLLKSVAEKLTRMLRQVDTVSRFGGDEFVLILPEQKDTRAALQVARKIVGAFRDTVVLDGHSLAVTSSIGISLYPDHGADIDTILKNADSAMYKAKQAGRNRYQFYNCQY